MMTMPSCPMQTEKQQVLRFSLILLSGKQQIYGLHTELVVFQGCGELGKQQIREFFLNLLFIHDFQTTKTGCTCEICCLSVR